MATHESDHKTDHKAPVHAAAHKVPAPAPAPVAPPAPPDPNRPVTPAEQAVLDKHSEKVVEAFHQAKADGTPDAAPRTKAEQDAIK